MIRISVTWNIKKLLKTEISPDFSYQFLELQAFHTCSKWQLTCPIMVGALYYKTTKYWIVVIYLWGKMLPRKEMCFLCRINIKQFLHGQIKFLTWAKICVCVLSDCCCAQSCLTLCDPMDFSLPGSSIHGDFPGKNTGVGCHFLLPRNLPNPRIEPRSPTLQVDSLPSKSPGKSKWLLGSLLNRVCWASLIAQLVKNLPAMQENLVWFLGWEDSLEKG